MALPVPRGRQIDVLALRPRGHIVVLGTAGSGKTTIAALRAQFLSDLRTAHGGPTLLVTFTKSLVVYLKSIGREELSHVTVETVHQFARGYLKSLGLIEDDNICRPEEQKRFIEEAAEERRLFAETRTIGLAHNVVIDLLVREFKVIVLSDLTRDDYVARVVDKSEDYAGLIDADAIYDVLETYRSVRAWHGKRYDWDDVMLAAWIAIQEDQSPRRYKHIVIDEGQDIAPVMLKTLIAAVPPDGTVTFFGDVAQQIYGRETNWRAAGFEVDKPETFEENRRNTPQIARLALAIASMPYYENVPDIVEPTFPMDAGPLPTLVRYDSEDAEVASICAQAREASITQNVAIICMNNFRVEAIVKSLQKAGANDVLKLDRQLPRWSDKPRIYVSTYHNSKGLEFGAVILPFLSNEDLPEPWLRVVLGEEAASTNSGSLLYVGVTRCRRSLVLTYSGIVTPLLPRNNAQRPLYVELLGK